MLGYGTPIYTNITYPFPKNPPFIDHSDNPVGSYRHTFRLPDSWKGRRVILHFDGSTAGMYVWVNGQKAGYVQSTKNQAEFDISSFVCEGNNTIACEVYRWTDGSYLEDQDFWRLSGIDRDVYIYSTADERILDFFADAGLDVNYRDGVLQLNTVLQNHSDLTKDTRLDIRIYDTANRQVASQSKQVRLKGNSSETVDITHKLRNVRKWSAETPYLYTLVLSLTDNKGNVIESTSSRIGFRKVEIKDSRLLVNGQPIEVHGVNLHEHHQTNGHVVDRETMLSDIRTMKRHNVNAVRMSHYPQSPLWYDLCDEYGLYVVDEANIEIHAMGAEHQGGFDKSVHPAYLPPMERSHSRPPAHNGRKRQEPPLRHRLVDGQRMWQRRKLLCRIRLDKIARHKPPRSVRTGRRSARYRYCVPDVSVHKQHEGLCLAHRRDTSLYHV